MSGRTALILAGIVALGSVVRLIPVATADFPLNDGALFLAMSNAIRDSGFALPATATYNGTPIALAYPPLGLYLTAVATQLTGGDGIDIARWMPLAFSIASIPVAFMIFRELFQRDAPALIGTAAFALIPRAYNWTIAGGGVTRAPGLLLAMIAIWAALRMVRSDRRRWVVVAGVAGGVAGLFHPESGMFALLSVAVVALASRRDWRLRLGRGLAAWGISAIIVLPWLILILARHDAEALIGALQTGGAVAEGALRLLTFGYTEGYLEILGVVAGVGLAICLLRREWLLPLWAAVIFLAGSRASLTYASIPVAGAVAMASHEVGNVVPALFRRPVPRPVALAALSAAFVICAVNAVASAQRDDSPLRALSPDARAGLRWIASETPTDASFLVMDGEPWPLDAVSEWFPNLAHRRSLATVQGTEWAGPGAFGRARDRQAWLLNCSTTLPALDCAQSWDQTLHRVDYVVLGNGRAQLSAGTPCCRALTDLVVAAGGRPVFENDEMVVIQLSQPQ